jgi:hypothetical protein
MSPGIYCILFCLFEHINTIYSYAITPDTTCRQPAPVSIPPLRRSSRHTRNLSRLPYPIVDPIPDNKKSITDLISWLCDREFEKRRPTELLDLGA